MLRQCLAVTPSRRPDLSEIFKHQWLNQPIVTYAESFKIVLQRHLQRKKEAQSENKLKKSSKIEENNKQIDKSAKIINEFATTKNIPTSNSNNNDNNDDNDDNDDTSSCSTHFT